MKLIVIFFLIFYSTFCSFSQKWSELIANSVINRSPLRYSNKWDYVVGTALRGFQELYEENKNLIYYNYLKNTIDYVVEQNGIISGYKKSDYNLDMIKEGSILLYLYKKTGDTKYKIAADSLRKQLFEQPRTSDGGFWHKKIYPYQMWLDGLYMAQPFYAEYSSMFNRYEDFEDVVKQFVLMEQHARDVNTGLLYHGWDEKKVQIWADPITGCSKSFWGRAMGWYMMGLIDVLDFIPNDFYKKDSLINILNRLTNAIVKYQDTSGCWFQVVDQIGREGNYLESSASCMFVYSILKGIRKGYLNDNFLTYALKGYNGILRNFVVKNGDNYDIVKTCCSAGLSNDRDGSYEYYVYNTSICTNDGKAIGPFILASLEYEKLSTGVSVNTKNEDFYCNTDNKTYIEVVSKFDIKEYVVKIFSITGIEKYHMKSVKNTIINISDLKPGIYILNVVGINKNYQFKFLII